MELTLSRAMDRSWPFWSVMAVFWLVAGILVLNKGYAGSFQFLNQYHLPILDQASYYFLTHLGDGLILPLMLLLWMWRKDPGLALGGVFGVLIAGILAQVLKRAIFEDWGRPAAVLPGEPLFHPNPPQHHSFPSGHATVMAAGGFVFAWFLGREKRFYALLVGLLTVLLCLTRVILGVHFLGDILVGSLIGAVVAVGLIPVLALAFRRLAQRSGPLWQKRWRIIVIAVAGLGIIGQFIHLISKQG